MAGWYLTCPCDKMNMVCSRFVLFSAAGGWFEDGRGTKQLWPPLVARGASADRIGTAGFAGVAGSRVMSALMDRPCTGGLPTPVQCCRCSP